MFPYRHSHFVRAARSIQLFAVTLVLALSALAVRAQEPVTKKLEGFDAYIEQLLKRLKVTIHVEGVGTGLLNLRGLKRDQRIVLNVEEIFALELAVFQYGESRNPRS